MSDLVGNPEDRFSRVEAHLVTILNQVPLYTNVYRSSVTLRSSIIYA